MTGRSAPSNLQPGFSLPAFEKSAPPPQPALVAARIELHSSAGDVVADLFGRGGWVARAAVDRQRRAISLESTPLTRMLAEVVLRPPDVRHLDAAFQGMAASPRRESSLKVSLGDLYATRCATCGRMLVVDDIVWALPDGADPEHDRRRRGDPDRPPLPMHRVPRPARRLRAAPGPPRRRRPGAGARRRRGRGGARGAARPVRAGRWRGEPRRRAPRAPHAAPAGRAGRDPRSDRGRPARRPGPRRPPARLPALDPAGEPPRDDPGPHVGAAHRRRARPPALGHPVARAQPVAGVRGRVPARPRLRPAAGGRRAGAAPGAARGGPAEPRGGDRDGGPRALEPVGPPPPARRRPTGTAGRPPPRGSASCWASRPSDRASSDSARPTTRPRGSSGARPRRCSRSMPSPGRRCARRGAGRP